MGSQGVMTPLARRGLATMVAIAMFAINRPAICWAANGTSRPTVLNISGLCIALPDGARLATGDKLKPGQKFLFPHPESSDYIDILLPDGQFYTVDCSRTFACRRNRKVPNSGDDNPVVTFALNLIKSVALPSDEQEMGENLNRGPSGTGELVLESMADQIDVAPMLFDAPPGKYTLQFKSRPAGAVPSDLHPFTVTLPALDPDDTHLGPVQTGLYAVTIDGPTSRLYWILVADPSRYSSAAQAFSNAKGLSHSWNNEQSVHNFLRAYLVSLSRHGAQ